MEPQVWKLVQKRAYDLLSHRYGLVVILGGAIMITVSAFHFGEVGVFFLHTACTVCEALFIHLLHCGRS